METTVIETFIMHNDINPKWKSVKLSDTVLVKSIILNATN